MIRRGLSMIEALVVICIMAILIGLLLVAVQKSRQRAGQLSGMNNVKQIALGVQHYASDHAGRFPSIRCDPERQTMMSVFDYVLPYVDGTFSAGGFVKTFVNPSDPSLGDTQFFGPPCSYGGNYQLFKSDSFTVDAVIDGCSSTLMIAEHYANCNGIQFTWTYPLGVVATSRMALFALNVHPVTQGDPPVTVASKPGVTYQVAPPATGGKGACDYYLAQTPDEGGMTVAMADGSCRRLSPTIRHEVYWALVTPDGGEAVGSW